MGNSHDNIRMAGVPKYIFIAMRTYITTTTNALAFSSVISYGLKSNFNVV